MYVLHKLVLETTIRRSVPLMTLRLGDTQITCTKGHPLWVVGQGWRMAKRIEEGDRVYCLGGTYFVEQTDAAPPSDAYNLVVDEFNTYFVTEAAVLAHDNTYRSPTTALIPGFLREGI